MHGREGEESIRRLHMWPVPAPGIGAAAIVNPSPSDSLQSESDCFLKDGRKIRVGECALFQAGNAPPFIGKIRWFRTSEENYLKLCVNWLYRPADIKLAKGILHDAAPNEVFYSFHKDVISAASLLHPCKVAFLRKGAELPAGISSFVCRRVYDIESKCLWWLTDQDYVDKRQEEVDQLLDRTQLEMHAALQSGGRSPKPLNGPSSTHQLKPGSDSVPNSSSSLPSQVKGRKRGDRSDLDIEPIKRDRDRSVKAEDGDTINYKLDNIKAELAKITEKGGLDNSEAVEKLVNLMLLDRTERKIDSAGRVMLADIIAATERYDCLGRFVQLRGVSVLDDWLQEAHKGKNGDGNSPKESDKATEELILALLRALDRLPVNLNALQACHIGKSVNNLRSHKNSEIQKKARSLVDTWKKRVGEEMKINDAKSVGSSQAVTWPGKPGFSEVPHTGDRRSGSTEVIMKNPISQPTAPKGMPGKSGHADFITKSTPVATGSIKLQSPLSAPAAISSKDSMCKTTGGCATPELPLPAVKEEKSSSSSQSQNNSQSCSSDHPRAKGSLKEDARSSTAVSVNVGKTSGGSSRHRRSSNGLHGKNITGVQKEGSSGKSCSLSRTTAMDKTSQSGQTCEKPLDMPVADHGNGHRLIVRLPNPGRSPARSVSGGSFEDPSVMGSRASSPGLCEKHEQNNDHKVKLRNDSSQPLILMDADGESEQKNEKGLVGLDEGDRSLLGSLEYQSNRGSEESGKGADIPRNASPSSENEKQAFLTEIRARNSFSSINALVESCAKYSEASAPLAVGDDIGMNLLASVAAGEICKSELISPCGSPKILPPDEEPWAGKNDAKSRLASNEVVAPIQAQSDDTADVDFKKHEKNVEISARDDSRQAGTTFSSDKKTDLPLHDRITAEPIEQPPVSNLTPHRSADSAIKSDGKLEKQHIDRCLPIPDPCDNMECEGDGAYQHQDKQIASKQVAESHIDCKPTTRSPSTQEHNNIDFTCEKVEEGKMNTSDVVCKVLDDGSNNTASSQKIETLIVERSSSCPNGKEVQGSTAVIELPQHVVVSDRADALDRPGDDADALSNSDKAPCPQNADESKTKMSDSLGMHLLESDAIERKEHANIAPSSVDDQVGSASNSLATTSEVDKNVQPKDNPTKSANREVSPNIIVKEIEQSVKPTGSKMSSGNADGSEDLASSTEVSSLAVKAESDISAKLDFDLNEGIHVDDGHPCEPDNSTSLVCSSVTHLPIASSLVPPFSNSLPAPITVAAPAKGPFVPPENLLKIKGELGWKGSAATSAFRPAEPRKVLELPLSTSDIASCDVGGKQSRALLDIDLNVPDERLLEDMASQNSDQTVCSETGNSNHDAPRRAACRLDLDLNRVDEVNENGQILASSSRRVDMTILPVRSPYERLPNAVTSCSRDFDLNNGPGVDEVAELAPRSQVAKAPSNAPFLPPAAGLRMNNAEIANMFSWFPPNNSYPAVAIPSFLPDRGEQPYPLVAAPGAHRILGSVTGGSTFGSDIYRGPMLSSSPAMAFSPATAFPYAGFPFASSYPLASTSFSGGSATYADSSSAGSSCFAAIPSQFVGPAGAATSHYPRPYMVSLAEGNTIGGSENSRKWVRQGLDLNAGPGSINAEGRGDDRLPPSSRQVLVATSNAMLEEQARMYQVPGVGVKRKEPEGGWDAEKSAYKQLSWQ